MKQILSDDTITPAKSEHRKGTAIVVGAGTHPGAGIPGVLLSANITSRLVIEDLARAQNFSRR